MLVCRGVCALVGAVVAVIAVSLAGGGPAVAASSYSYVVMFSDSGDYIGGGLPREFDSGNARIAVSGTR